MSNVNDTQTLKQRRGVTPNLRRLLTTRQVAEILDVSPRTVSKWIREGELRATKVRGATWRVRYIDLIFFLYPEQRELLDMDTIPPKE